jgi:hypothetical protein
MEAGYGVARNNCIRHTKNLRARWFALTDTIKRDAWVAFCDDFLKLPERIYMSGFRGWRYFDLNEHRGNPESKIRL